MALTLSIDVDEQSDGESFYLYDTSDWSAVTSFDDTLVTALTITATYDDVDYTYTLANNSEYDTATGANNSFVNLFGTAASSYFEITPDLLTDSDGNAISSTAYFSDGYYNINLAITYDGGDYDVDNEQGFLAHATLRAALLPLVIDMDNYDFDKERLVFLTIALLNSAKNAAELGRTTQFDTVTGKINDFYEAEDISSIW